MNLTQTPIIGNGTVKLRTRFHKLGFKIALIGVQMAADIKSALIASKLEVTKTHPSYGTKKVLFKQSLGLLLEMASYNQGSVVMYGAYGSTYVEGTVEFTPKGSLVPIQNEEYLIELTGMAVNAETDINSYPTVEDATSSYNYQQISIDANVQTPANIASAKWLAIPKDTLTELELHYPDGYKEVWKPRELSRICQENNELSIILSGQIADEYRKLYVIKVSQAVTALITQTVVGNVYLVNEEIIF